MALLAFAAPIMPGKTDQWKQFIGELRGSRFRDYSASRRQLGVHERAFFQSTPQGDFVIVTLEGNDPAGALKRLGASNDEFTHWFVQQVKEIHGLDLTHPENMAVPELGIDSQAGGISPR
jgi:hypothetical protein